MNNKFSIDETQEKRNLEEDKTSGWKKFGLLCLALAMAVSTVLIMAL